MLWLLVVLGVTISRDLLFQKGLRGREKGVSLLYYRYANSLYGGSEQICVVLTSKHFTCLLFYFLYDQVLHFLFIFGILFHEIFRPSDVRTVMIRQTIPRWKTDEEDKLTKMISVCTNNKHRNKTTTNIQLATEDSWNVARRSGDPWQKPDEGGRGVGGGGKGVKRGVLSHLSPPGPFVRLLNACNAGYLEREALNHWKDWGKIHIVSDDIRWY